MINNCECNCDCKNRNIYDYMCLTPSVSKITIVIDDKRIYKFILNCNHFASCHLSRTSCKNQLKIS